MLRIVNQALTFDDVLLVPDHSDVLPKDVDLKTRLTHELSVFLNQHLLEVHLSDLAQGGRHRTLVLGLRYATFLNYTELVHIFIKYRRFFRDGV